MTTLSSADRWRPGFHITAPQGLLNDPNGLIHWRGQVHVFYQWNPRDCSHANKAWAHVASDDLVHWRRLPVAISPTDAFDRDGCYSGSAVAEGQDMVLVYTGNVRDAAGGRQTYQCLARSRDGVVFDKLGPVISGPLPGHTAHFRDPKVWHQDGAWWMVLGAQTEALHGTVLLLRGDGLSRWQPVGALLQPGPHGYMCECPDLFTLDGETVLLFCEQRAATDQAPASNLAGWVAGHRRAGSADLVHGPFQRLDHGRDFYAPQTFLHGDGRRILIGWMGLPEQAEAPTVADGWLHCLSVPRELRLIGGRLCQRPVRELAALRGPETRHEALQISAPLTLSAGDSWDMRIDGIAGDVSLRLLGAELRLQGGVLTLTGDEVLGRAEVSAGTGLRILADRSSLEIFADDGAVVISARVYPRDAAPAITLAATGARIARLSLWPMRRAMLDEAQGAPCQEEELS